MPLQKAAITFLLITVFGEPCFGQSAFQEQLETRTSESALSGQPLQGRATYEMNWYDYKLTPTVEENDQGYMIDWHAWADRLRNAHEKSMFLNWRTLAGPFARWELGAFVNTRIVVFADGRIEPLIRFGYRDERLKRLVLDKWNRLSYSKYTVFPPGTRRQYMAFDLTTMPQSGCGNCSDKTRLAPEYVDR